MTIVSLHPSIAGLIVTVLNGLVEVVCLWAMHKGLALYECHQWKTNSSISIRGHRRCHKFLTVLAFLMFIVSETLVSINTDNDLRPKYKEEPCVNLKAKIASPKADGNDPFSSAITYRCMQINGTMFSFHTGKYNIRNGSIRCDNKPVYRYRTNIRTTRSIHGAVTECEPGVSDSCVSVFAENSTVSISTLYSVDSELDKNREEEFFPTEVLFDIKGQLKRIARNALTAYLAEDADELTLRRKIFFEVKNDRCKFEDGVITFTKIPGGVLWGVFGFWLLVLLLFILMYLKKKNIFYEIANACDWATKTHQNPSNSKEENTQFVCVHLNGEKRMFLTDSQKLDHSMLESEMEYESKISRMSDDYA